MLNFGRLHIHSIRTRLSLILFFTISLVQAGVFFAYYHSTKSSLQIELSELEHQLINQLTISLKEPLWNYQMGMVNDIIDSEMLEDQVFAILVKDKNNALVFGKQRDEKWTPVQTTVPPSGEYNIRDGRIRVYDESIGRVELYVTDIFMKKKLIHLLKNMVINNLVIDLLLFTILFLGIGQGVIRPIYRLAEGVRAIASGDLNVVITPENKDEIGRLAGDTEVMRQSIKRLTDHLEDMVKERTWQLETATREAKDALKVKSRFLANMSHEIRTPMNAIVGFSDLTLKTVGVPPTAKDYVQKVSSSAKSLLTIINDILDLSKLEADKLELESIRFHLNDMLHEIIQIFSIQAMEKKLELKLNYSEDLKPVVIGDMIRIRQVVVNLVGNAVKFTPSGSVTLDIFPDNGDIHFKISDTGIGMSADQAEQVFESFKQGDDSTMRRYGGTGLGTTISKQLVELMGGHIWCESQEGLGSVFHFTLPLKQADEKPVSTDPKTGREDQIPRSPRRFKILMAEDNVFNGELVLINLGNEQGHHITWVYDGTAAVEAFQNDHFHLILMDIHMPGTDGIQATQVIRRMEEKNGGHIPIIAFTASATIEEQKLFSSSGFDGFIKKPVDLEELASMMESMVPEGEGEIASPVSKSAKESTDILLEPVADLGNLTTALKNWKTPAAYIKALQQFAKEKENLPDMLSHCVDQEDYTSAAEITHGLIGLPLELNVLKQTALALDKALKERDRSKIEPLLPAFKKEMKQVLAAIKKLKTETRLVLPPKALDEKRVFRLFKDLYTALDMGNPESAEQIVDDLFVYFKPGTFDRTLFLMDNYEFEPAKRSALDVEKTIK